MDTETRINESRLGWTGKTIPLTLTSLAFVTASLMLPLWISVLDGNVFGIVFLLIAWSAYSRKIALRIDPQGITLGTIPIPYGYKKDVIPWRGRHLDRSLESIYSPLFLDALFRRSATIGISSTFRCLLQPVTEIQQ